MSNLQDVLRAKAAAVQSAKQDGVIPGTRITEVPSVDLKVLANVATGPEGSVAMTGETNAGVAGELEYDLDEAKHAASVSTYKATHLRKFFKKNATKISPEGGYYYAADEEEDKELQHFAAKGKVELVSKEPIL